MPEYTNRDLDWARAKVRAITHDPDIISAILHARAQSVLNDAITRRQLNDMNRHRPPPHQQPGKK